MKRFTYIMMWVCAVISVLSLVVTFAWGFDPRFLCHFVSFGLNAVAMYYLHQLTKMK